MQSLSMHNQCNAKAHFHFFIQDSIFFSVPDPVSALAASCVCGSFSMEYSALRLETLALHEVLKAGLPTYQLGPVNKS